MSQIHRIVDVAGSLVMRNLDEARHINHVNPDSVAPTLASAAVCNAIVLCALCDIAGLDIEAVLECAREATRAKGAGPSPVREMREDANRALATLHAEALALTRMLS